MFRIFTPIYVFMISCIAFFPDIAAAEEVIGQQINTVRKIIDWVLEAVVKYSFQALGGMVVLAVG